jgi:hypothetical protein
LTAASSRGAAIERSWRLKRDSETLYVVKRHLEEHRDFCHPQCREAAIMATWELAENVVKYGLADDDGTAGTVGIAVSRRTMLIRTGNVAQWLGGSHEAISTITRVSAAANVGELYRQRLHELFGDNPGVRTRLGLFRVAHEGGFQLSYRYDAPFLEITAERRCPQSP